MFPKNIGATGRLTRFVIAVALTVGAYLFQSWIVLAIALFVYFEALKGWCIFNHLIGRNECQIK